MLIVPPVQQAFECHFLLSQRRTASTMTSAASSSVIRVGSRLLFRFAIIYGFASLAGVDFIASFVPLLWMVMVLCLIVAVLRKESLRDRSLNHWDEAAIFGVLASMASAFSASTT
jgi:hypothetical protein